MRLFKPTTMAIFGIGFLAGSRSGRGAWNAFENQIAQLQNRTSSGGTGMSGNGTGSAPNRNQGAVTTTGTELR